MESIHIVTFHNMRLNTSLNCMWIMSYYKQQRGKTETFIDLSKMHSQKGRMTSERKTINVTILESASVKNYKIFRRLNNNIFKYYIVLLHIS